MNSAHGKGGWRKTSRKMWVCAYTYIKRIDAKGAEIRRINNVKKAIASLMCALSVFSSLSKHWNWSVQFKHAKWFAFGSFFLSFSKHFFSILCICDKQNQTIILTVNLWANVVIFVVVFAKSLSSVVVLAFIDLVGWMRANETILWSNFRKWCVYNSMITFGLLCLERCSWMILLYLHVCVHWNSIDHSNKNNNNNNKWIVSHSTRMH